MRRNKDRKKKKGAEKSERLLIKRYNSIYPLKDDEYKRYCANWYRFNHCIPSFGLGAIYANWPYDLNTLWRATDPNAFAKSLVHYQTWAQAPMYVHYVLHAVGFIGLVGHFIKLYKPDEEAKYFEYGSLALFMIAIVIYLTNLRTGINAAITGEWVLVGVLVLQGGLYYAQWYDEELKKEFYETEAREAALAAERQAKQEEDIIASTNEGGSDDANVEIIAESDRTAIDTKGKKKKSNTVKKRKS
ncbi:ER membrane protein SH3 family protein [Candida parapsilosis]|nr:ER membrane protein SH3 family protein [Candida parapsilosis]